MYTLYKRINEKLVDFHDKKLRGVIFQWLRTVLAYTSNNIEGNTLTREETMLTVEEGLTSGSKPLKYYVEARNHAEAFDYMLSLMDVEDIHYEDIILKIHAIILNGINDENKGCYRNVHVRIAGSNAVLPNPVKVPYLMEEFTKKLDSRADDILKALEAHYKLVEIHPFIDGNGRTARLLMNLILLRTHVLPMIIAPRERKRYLAAINGRNTQGKLLHYYKYMLGLLGKSQDMYAKIFTNEKQAAKQLMTISEFAKQCGVPISTIRYYLRVKKLVPRTYTNAGYMLFDEDQIEFVRGKRGK